MARQVLAHLNDAERVVNYSFSRIQRGGPSPMAKVEENRLASTSDGAGHVAYHQALLRKCYGIG